MEIRLGEEGPLNWRAEGGSGGAEVQAVAVVVLGPRLFSNGSFCRDGVAAVLLRVEMRLVVDVRRKFGEDRRGSSSSSDMGGER